MRRTVLRDFHRPRLWLGLWMAAIAIVIALSLLPPPAMSVPPGTDKLEHLLAYAALSGFAVMLFARMRAQALAAAVLVVLGVSLEVAQATLTQTRAAESADALANTLGVLAGLLVSATPMATLLQRLDARIHP